MFVHILKYSYVSILVIRLYIYNYAWMSWKFVDFSCKLDQLQFRKILLWSHIQLDIHLDMNSSLFYSFVFPVRSYIVWCQPHIPASILGEFQ